MAGKAVAVIEPKESWCARWQRIEAFKPGVYALCVYGSIDAEASNVHASRTHPCDAPLLAELECATI